MRKRFVFLYAALLAGMVFFYTGCSGSPGSEPAARETVREQKTTELPPMLLTRLDGEQFMATRLEGKTVLVLFQPECDDCQRQAVQMQEHLAAFQDYSVYFVSNAGLQELARFAENYELDNRNNVHFAQVSLEDILNALGPMPAPSLFIYSADGRLVNTFKGETEIQQIIAHL